MFNLAGSEIIVILLLALVILGPEKLPEAMRKAGRAYSELRKMANSFQSEVRSVMDEPMSELRGTADAIREATDFGDKKGGAKKPAANVRAKSSSNAPPTDDGETVEQPEQPSLPASDKDADTGETEDTTEDLVTRTLSGDVDPHGEAPTT